MMSPVPLSLTLACLPLITKAHVGPRQAAGSLTTSSIPSEILIAASQSVTDTSLLASGTAVSELTSTATETTATSTSSFTTPSPTKSITPCTNSDGNFAPFCEPTNGSTITVGETYYVTWDKSFFSSDTTSVVVQVIYADSSTQSGSSVYSTGQVENSLGWAAIDVKEGWLEGKSTNNVTLHIAQVSTDENSNNAATIYEGPTVQVTSEDPSSSKDSSNTALGTSSSSKNYAHLGTVVGLTIGFSFLALLLVSGLFIAYRRYQRKHRPYGIAQSRSQRLDQRQQHGSWHGDQSLESHRQGMVMA